MFCGILSENGSGPSDKKTSLSFGELDSLANYLIECSQELENKFQLQSEAIRKFDHEINSNEGMIEPFQGSICHQRYMVDNIDHTLNCLAQDLNYIEANVNSMERIASDGSPCRIEPMRSSMYQMLISLQTKYEKNKLLIDDFNSEQGEYMRDFEKNFPFVSLMDKHINILQNLEKTLTDLEINLTENKKKIDGFCS